MSDDDEVIIIIRRLHLRTRNLPPATVQRLKAIAARAASGSSLTLPQKLYVAWAAVRCAGREP